MERRKWTLEAITPSGKGEWAEIPLDDSIARETVEEVLKHIVPEKGVWEFRISEASKE